MVAGKREGCLALHEESQEHQYQMAFMSGLFGIKNQNFKDNIPFFSVFYCFCLGNLPFVSGDLIS